MDDHEVALQVTAEPAFAHQAHRLAEKPIQVHARGALQIGENAAVGGQQHVSRCAGEGCRGALDDAGPVESRRRPTAGLSMRRNRRRNRPG